MSFYTRDEQIRRAQSRSVSSRILLERNEAIRRLVRAGESDAAILRRYGVGVSTLAKLRAGAGCIR